MVRMVGILKIEDRRNRLQNGRRLQDGWRSRIRMIQSRRAQSFHAARAADNRRARDHCA